MERVEVYIKDDLQNGETIAIPGSNYETGIWYDDFLKIAGEPVTKKTKKQMKIRRNI